MMASASSMLPWEMSQRGDSGSQGTVAKRIPMKMNWKARGRRHDTGPETKEKP